MTTLTGRRVVAPLAVCLALLAVAVAAQTWLTGRALDAGLGESPVSATAADVAGGFVGAVLVAAAGVLASCVTGRRARIVAMTLAVAGALGAAALATWVLADPSGRLGPLAATAVGRTGTLPVTAHVTGWAWTGLLAAYGLLGTSLLGALGVRRWPGPTSRYDAPVARSGSDAGRARLRGERVATEWDRLTAGEDPTDVPEPPQT